MKERDGEDRELDEPQPGDIFDYAAKQMVQTIRVDRIANGLDPDTGLPLQPRRSMRMYSCRNVLQSEDGVMDEVDPVRCEEPSRYVAKDNAARYGHVCADCWMSFEPEEQALYVDPEKEPEPSSAVPLRPADPTDWQREWRRWEGGE